MAKIKVIGIDKRDEADKTLPESIYIDIKNRQRTKDQMGYDNRCTHRVFMKAANLIDKVGWTKGVLARDSLGHEVSADSEKACSFCMMGAIARARHDLDISMWNIDIPSQVPDVGYSLTYFNDKIAVDAAEVSAKLRQMAIQAKNGQVGE